MSVDDLKVTQYDDELAVVLDAAFALNGTPGADGQGLASGRLTGQVLAKNSDLDWDTKWENPTLGIPVDGTAGQLLAKVSSSPYDTIWITPAEVEDSSYAKLAVANTFTQQQTITQGVLTTSQPALTITQEWNNIATVFNAFKINLTTNDLFDYGSQVIAVNVDGADVFKVSPYGEVETAYGMYAGEFGALGALCLIAFTGNNPRWMLRKVDAESTGNAGSNFEIRVYNDAGSSLSVPLKITRSTGVTNFSVTPTIAGTSLSTLYATQTYVNDQDALRASLAGANTFGGHNTFNRVTVNGGPLTVDRTAIAAAADVVLAANALQSAFVNFQTATSPRWRIGRGSTAETGTGTSSAGSDFNLQAYDNSGVSLGNVFHVIRGLRTLVLDAPFNLATVTAPASPNNGDVWFDGTNLKLRISGVTRTITVT